MSVNIGITALYKHELMEAYIPESLIMPIVEIGANTVMLPLVPDANGAITFLEHLDGLVISGSHHGLDASLYGLENMSDMHYGISPYKNAEVSLIQAAVKIQMPILGICGGHQSVNVALGGTMMQCITNSVEHSLRHDFGNTDTPLWCPVHKVTLSGYAKKLLGDVIMTNSFHADAIDKIGKGLNISGKTSDGICEMLESADMEKQYILCTQFHPEMMRGEIHRSIFADFIRAVHTTKKRV